jgi:hypothetical protein
VVGVILRGREVVVTLEKDFGNKFFALHDRDAGSGTDECFRAVEFMALGAHRQLREGARSIADFRDLTPK